MVGCPVQPVQPVCPTCVTNTTGLKRRQGMSWLLHCGERRRQCGDGARLLLLLLLLWCCGDVVAVSSPDHCLGHLFLTLKHMISFVGFKILSFDET